MCNFDELFCKLVHSNRRVIIPDIGAFITNSPDENTVFSPLLKHNDGFLEDELQKEGVDNSVIFLKELAENIISMVERGQCYYITGMGYFFKDGGIRFVFEDADKNADNGYSGNADSLRNKSKLWIIVCLLCICAIVAICLLFLIFDIYNTKIEPKTFTFQVWKPSHQFVIVDRSEACDEISVLPLFPQAEAYHVVVACFEDRDNAEKFVLQCKKNGYDSPEILSVTSVLYPVSIGVFASRDEALNKKQEYDNLFGENSMILKLNKYK